MSSRSSTDSSVDAPTPVLLKLRRADLRPAVAGTRLHSAISVTRCVSSCGTHTALTRPVCMPLWRNSLACVSGEAPSSVPTVAALYATQLSATSSSASRKATAPASRSTPARASRTGAQPATESAVPTLLWDKFIRQPDTLAAEKAILSRVPDCNESAPIVGTASSSRSGKASRTEVSREHASALRKVCCDRRGATLGRSDARLPTVVAAYAWTTHGWRGSTRADSRPAKSLSSSTRSASAVRASGL
mmetsp:Transcript_2944/g.5284  ORF Transcript_2944/g.5284 Transcript_2944/m.5284 type:complete len:247 (-) Transcript_2944:3201-3941(-)